MHPTAPLEKEAVPMIRGLDSHPLKKVEFIAGTHGCDVWEVDKDPRVLIEGHQADVYSCAAHPRDPALFATASESNRVSLWHAHKHELVRSASMGFVCRSIAFSETEFPSRCIPGKSCCEMLLVDTVIGMMYVAPSSSNIILA